MADGATHDRDSLLLAIPSGLATYGVAIQVGYGAIALPLAIGAAAGGFFQRIANPDLDMVGRTVAEGHVARIHGGLGWLWQTVWMPYGRLVAHRSFWSHFPIVGTVGRVGYLLVPLLVPVLLGFVLSPLVRRRASWGMWPELILHDLLAGLLLACLYGLTMVGYPPLNFLILAGMPIGMAVGDLAHWLRDDLPPFYPRIFPGDRRPRRRSRRRREAFWD